MTAAQLGKNRFMRYSSNKLLWQEERRMLGLRPVTPTSGLPASAITIALERRRGTKNGPVVLGLLRSASFLVSEVRLITSCGR
jgi:hypothetical protein